MDLSFMKDWNPQHFKLVVVESGAKNVEHEVTINIGCKPEDSKTKNTAEEADDVDDVDEGIVTELLGVFYGDRSKARDFLSKVNTMRDTDICQYVKKQVGDGIISDLSYKKPLWDVLHSHGIYEAGYRNWASQV